eukprot:CAMPEP_0181331918 /NCGR_PEP_ID=MMETSP1101-20121128/24789_1 /TAXON_ID=46948 /ORGANISM="Rhodomonas abbreviata, Strain Caron Lab Isolate" /LENGTH=260 /DNA_ID=CAMNT_0023441473 /DNA_START=100 /DNA_END=882 /DNA_ORIENTATION=+
MTQRSAFVPVAICLALLAVSLPSCSTFSLPNTFSPTRFFGEPRHILCSQSRVCHQNVLATYGERAVGAVCNGRNQVVDEPRNAEQEGGVVTLSSDAVGRALDKAELSSNVSRTVVVRRATIDELTVAMKNRMPLPNLLAPIGLLCSRVLYGTDNLQEAVMKDFQRRYGKHRQHAGFLILALQEKEGHDILYDVVQETAPRGATDDEEEECAEEGESASAALEGGISGGGGSGAEAEAEAETETETATNTDRMEETARKGK